MKRIKRVAVAVLLALVLLVSANGPGTLSAVEVAAAPYRFGLLGWELSNLPDKWWHKLTGLMPWTNSPGPDEGKAQVEEFFRLGMQIQSLEDRVTRQVSQGARSGLTGDDLDALTSDLDDLKQRQQSLSSSVQATLEAELGAAISKEGLNGFLGTMFPPVDLVFSDSPNALVVSPRDRIDRRKTVLLRPDLAVQEMDVLEGKLLQEQDLAALVVGTGGIATYPSIVPGKGGLLRAAEIGAHEWLHQYWFFRPLGWNYDSSADMRTLNETAADLAGKELGRMVYQSVTGEAAPEEPRARPVEPEPGVFDFGQEMRLTRLEVDRLLAMGQVEEAEAYMERRRQEFVDNGYFIRKLNQAYFAFYGTYAANPASVSPVRGELERLRVSVDSVGQFVRLVGGFGSYQEFREHLASLP